MKDKLLIIAHTLPLFDLQSGDFRLFMLIKRLSKSYDITFMGRDLGKNRDIILNRYAPALEEIGVKVHIGGDSFKHAITSNKYKAAILEFYDIAEQYLERIRFMQPTCRIILDTVDIHYLRLQRKYLLTGDEKDLEIAEDTKRRELAVYAKADILLAVTREDGDIIKNENPDFNVRIVPNVHELVHPKGEKNRNEMIFVGGFKHHPNIDAVQHFCRDILPGIRKKLPDVRFTIVGSSPPEEVKILANDHVEVTGYVPETAPYLHRSYISVAPLRYGAGMKGKIGEAMAHGLPVVTTSIGAEGMGLTDRENILIADSPEGFADAVVELMSDPVLYEKIRNNSMEHIDRNYTPEKVGLQMTRIIDSLDGSQDADLTFTGKAFLWGRYAIDLAKRKIMSHG